MIDSYQPYYLRVHLVGSHGAIMDGKFWSTRIAGLDPDRWTELGVKLETSADVVHHPYQRQFSAFFEALEQDRDMPLTSLEDAAKTFEIIFAADRSAELGTPSPALGARFVMRSFVRATNPGPAPVEGCV